jgi:sortase A
MTIIEAWHVNSLPIPAGSPVSAATSPHRTVSRTVAGPRTSHTEAARRRAAVAPGTWLARLEAPAIGLSVTVLEGADNRTLMRAAGHVEETAFPGEAGNIVIAGHRDTIFRSVGNLHAGDILVLKTSGYTYRYRITATRIINPAEVEVLGPTAHRVLTLVTCYPFSFIGHAPQRFIVRADLDSQEARSAQARQSN